MARNNLAKVRSIYIALSIKGGVGKTTVSTLLSLYFALNKVRTGLMDLDFVNSSTHILLDVNPLVIKYEEEKGIIPYMLMENLYYFTITPFTSDKPIALRGESVRNALREVLSIVKWDKVEFLFIDTPPGVSDEQLELIYNLRGLGNVKPLVISTPSNMSWNSVVKLLSLLRGAGYEDIYLVENMGSGVLEDKARQLGVKYAGFLPYLDKLEDKVRYIAVNGVPIDLRVYLDKVAMAILN
ncbi:MAG: P-loop NTPase [Desulfurococcaceae archaeon]